MTSALPGDARFSGWGFLFAAWTVALTATATVLFVGEVMGQEPCALCWYQRVFMFPLAIMLGLASYRADPGILPYALPLVGGAIAAFHTLLYVGIVPQAIEPCGQGPSCASADMTIFGSLPLPLLSLAAFIAIAALLLLARQRISL